jgi:hypothetical protein
MRLRLGWDGEERRYVGFYKFQGVLGLEGGRSMILPPIVLKSLDVFIVWALVEEPAWHWQWLITSNLGLPSD